MNKAIVVGIIILFTILPVSATLHGDLQSAPYNTESYTLHTFDCTDMTAIMTTHLIEKGYDARIQVYTSTGVIGHAMTIVYNHDNYSCTLIESTRKAVTTQIMHGLTLEGEYRGIVDAAENSRWGASEWGLELYLSERSKM